jgi:hypothetical protein
MGPTTRQPIAEHGLSLVDFWQQFVTVDTGGQLARPVPHREQRRFLSACDTVAPDGRRRYREYFLHWSKKTAKSFTSAVKAVHHLVADPFERQDRLVAIASFDEDQSRIIFNLARQLVERHAWLAKRIKINRAEMVYVEHARDECTGGTFTRDHVLRALPRDLKGSHGENWSLVVRDELWTEPDHAFSESLVISPTRPSGEVLYLSYHAPHAMMRAGTPFFDVLQRAKAGDPDLFYSHVGGRGEDAPWHVAPWITIDWIAQQEKILAASPSRYRRVVLNEPAGGDDALITARELSESLVPMAEPEHGESGCAYFLACDLGVVLDWTCVLVGHLDQKARLVLDVVRTWRGSHLAPVSLIEVQEAIADLHRRFRFEAVKVDQWQARQMVEQLQRQRVPASIVTMDGGTLDRLVTQLKSTFARRLIRIPERASDVIEQLESVVAVEAGRRRDLLKFQPGASTGTDATAHDDIAVTLALLLDMCWPSVGRIALPMAFNNCYRAASLPAFSCAACAGWQWARPAYKEYAERAGGDRVDLRTWRRRFVQDNEFTGRCKQSVWESWYA